MGAGNAGAGFGPAGFDPVIAARVDRYSLPSAARIDLAIKDTVVDDNGRVVATHPVDREVNFSFLTPKGSNKSAPDVGIESFGRQFSGTQLVEDVKQKVREAQPFARLVATGAVEHVSTTVEPIPTGGVVYTVRWRNLADPDNTRNLTLQS